MKPNVVDMTGARFGMLSVIEYKGTSAASKRGGALWLCKCDCGASITVLADRLRKGERKTCGCSTQSLKYKKHGQSGKPAYVVWALMIRRCHRPASSSEKAIYMDRGITVCDAWRNSFSQFIADMGPRPKGSQIDRIDNAKGYSPDNCRWATTIEQGRNKRTNRLVSFDGKTQCVSAWAEQTGIKEMTLWKRINAGWTAQRALTEPVKHRSTN